MSRLEWGVSGERRFEAGVDRGVLYIDDADGVVWNGLISVSESPSGGEAKPYYLDGVKYLNRSGSSEFEATIEAYTYPEEFAQCDGTRRVKNGLSVGQQARKNFGFTYRTLVGNDIDGMSHAYKIHVVYDALASPTEQAHNTLTDEPEAYNFSWSVTTRPSRIAGYKPTAHFVIDSNDTPSELLAEIENILYGSSTLASRLPSADELLFMFDSYSGGVDAGRYNSPMYATIDGGATPTTEQTSTIEGGTL